MPNENSPVSGIVGEVTGGVAGGTRPLTFGERAVGLTFNPKNNPKEQACKEQFALMIDALNNERKDFQEAENMDAVRMISIAITEVQSASMWAVKAITWK